MKTECYDGITAPRNGPEENAVQIVAPKKQWCYGTNKSNALVHRIAYVRLRWWVHDYGCMRRLSSPRMMAVTKCQRYIRLDDTTGTMCEIPKPDAVLCKACLGQGRNFPRGKKHEISLEVAKVKLGCIRK